jgi:hypothetical protein
MLDILSGTPLWVFAVLFVVTYFGLRACVISVESRFSLSVTPAIFVVVSLASLKLSQGYAIPLFGYALGGIAGWCLAQYFYTYDNVEREGDRLVLGGTVKVLLVYWCFFLWRYYLGYQAAVHPEMSDAMSAVVVSSLGAGLINGLIVGRSLRLLSFFKVDEGRAT